MFEVLQQIEKAEIELTNLAKSKEITSEDLLQVISKHSKQDIEEAKKNYQTNQNEKKDIDELVKAFNEKKGSPLTNKMKLGALSAIFEEHKEEIPEDVKQLVQKMAPKQFFNYLKKEYDTKSKPIVAPKKPAKEVNVEENNDLLEDDYTKILRDTDIDDVIAGLVDEQNPMTLKKVAETIGDKVGLDDRRIEKVFESNAEFKQFIGDYVHAMNDENEPDKPKLIYFLRFRLLEKENKAMKKETTEEEKLKVEAMKENDFERYLQQKKIVVIGHQTMDFLNKGGKAFNEMYIEEHVRRGLKGVLKPNYLRDLANQLGVEVNTLNTLSKTDEGLNKLFNDQLTAIREGIKKKT